MRQLRITKQITNRATHSLDKYLVEIGRVSLVTVEEEVELARRIREGDAIALEKLTKANLRFVVSVAKQYQNYGLTLDGLTRHVASSSSHMQCGGYARRSCRVWLNNPALYVCR
jgi:DNA-directed RNA polymerase sigma subunit (sigma70/sigma32)